MEKPNPPNKHTTNPDPPTSVNELRTRITTIRPQLRNHQTIIDELYAESHAIIRQLRRLGCSHPEIVEITGVPNATVQAIINGRNLRFKP